MLLVASSPRAAGRIISRAAGRIISRAAGRIISSRSCCQKRFGWLGSTNHQPCTSAGTAGNKDGQAMRGTMLTVRLKARQPPSACEQLRGVKLTTTGAAMTRRLPAFHALLSCAWAGQLMGGERGMA
eukprot:362768-Chlamydomonas_euryale.AAC.1